MYSSGELRRRQIKGLWKPPKEKEALLEGIILVEGDMEFSLLLILLRVVLINIFLGSIPCLFFDYDYGFSYTKEPCLL